MWICHCCQGSTYCRHIHRQFRSCSELNINKNDRLTTYVPSVFHYLSTYILSQCHYCAKTTSDYEKNIYIYILEVTITVCYNRYIQDTSYIHPPPIKLKVKSFPYNQGLPTDMLLFWRQYRLTSSSSCFCLWLDALCALHRFQLGAVVHAPVNKPHLPLSIDGRTTDVRQSHWSSLWDPETRSLVGV